MKSLIILLGRVSSLLLVVFLADARTDSNPEVDALLAFKSSLTDPLPVPVQNWFTGSGSPPCNWPSIQCNVNYKVISITLGGAKLSGQLVSNLANLTDLQYLELYENRLNGSIPPELGNLTNLVNLDLNGNELTGGIPRELAKLTQLKSLMLNDNQLSGCVSSEILDMKQKYGTRMNTTNNPDLCSEPSCVCP